MLSGKLVGVVVLAMAVLMGASNLKPHSEIALLSDWSAPPPWPIFIALNALAVALRAASDALTPPPIKMLELAMGYHHTILVHVAQKFKIPDLLADGPLSAAEIATKVGSDAQYMERIMYACAANGVFKLAASEPGKGHRFVNTALSAVLRVDHPNSMRSMVGHQAEEGYPACGKLADFLAKPNGPIAWDLAFPEYPFAKGGIWSLFEANPDREAQFGRAMTSLDSLGAKAMVEDGPWARFTRVVDVGGGRGHFMHRLLEAHPALQGVVVDRAPVIELAKKAWGNGGEFTAAAGRVKLQAGDFFQASSIPIAKNGDGYYMRYILHDWPLKEALTILRNVRAAIGAANVTLLLGECALPDHDKVGVPPVMYGIDVLMMAVFGGAQERTPAQWKDLLSQGGFELVDFHATRSLVHWVEAKPKPI
jgi:hypothetical protein